MGERGITLEAAPGQGYVRLKVDGALRFDEARWAVEEATEAYPTLNRLWDFRKADLTGWSADEMLAFADLVIARGRMPESLRVAALVARDVDFGLARMYQTLSQHGPPPQHAVFRDEAEAIAWVRWPAQP